jgi:uncharacterized membrane protein YeaQ/YmgE (transglycosylase-associated protein family)
MLMLAEISFNPATIAGWLVAGLLAAWLVSLMTEEPEYGAMGDFIGGGIGGLLGGLIYGFFSADAGFWGGTLVASLTAGIVVIGARAVLAMRRE